jgi:GT2 family glycosyltransferase
VIDRALFRHLGGYDETLPVYGAAEPEFSVRLWLSGYEIVNVPELRINHEFRQRAEHEARCASIRPLLLRNYLRFACYYLPPDLLNEAFRHYSSDSSIEVTSCIEELVRQGVWERRAELSRLPLDFPWYARRFSLPLNR